MGEGGVAHRRDEQHVSHLQQREALRERHALTLLPVDGAREALVDALDERRDVVAHARVVLGARVRRDAPQQQAQRLHAVLGKVVSVRAAPLRVQQVLEGEQLERHLRARRHSGGTQ